MFPFHFTINLCSGKTLWSVCRQVEDTGNNHIQWRLPSVVELKSNKTAQMEMAKSPAEYFIKDIKLANSRQNLSHILHHLEATGKTARYCCTLIRILKIYDIVNMYLPQSWMEQQKPQVHLKRIQSIQWLTSL